MSSNSVCNHTRDKQIGHLLRGRPILLSLVDKSYWTPPNPITITYNMTLYLKACYDVV